MTETATPQELALLRADEPIGLALIRSLEDTGELQRSGLRILDPNLTIEQFEVMLTVFGQYKRTLSFVIGDLANFADAAFTDDAYGQWLAQVYAHLPNGAERPGDRYDRWADLTGLKRETIRNYASVMARVAVSRRRDNLPFAHHDAVAALEPALQSEWLLAAEEKRWGREELRRRLHEAGHLKPRSQVRWTGGRLGALAPELEPPERSAQTDGTATQPPPLAQPAASVAPALEIQHELVDVDSATVEEVARRLVETAVLLEGYLEPVHPDNLDGGMQPRLVGISLGEDHYVVPRTLFDQLAALVAVEE